MVHYPLTCKLDDCWQDGISGSNKLSYYLPLSTDSLLCVDFFKRLSCWNARFDRNFYFGDYTSEVEELLPLTWDLKRVKYLWCWPFLPLSLQARWCQFWALPGAEWFSGRRQGQDGNGKAGRGLCVHAERPVVCACQAQHLQRSHRQGQRGNAACLSEAAAWQSFAMSCVSSVEIESKERDSVCFCVYVFVCYRKKIIRSLLSHMKKLSRLSFLVMARMEPSIFQPEVHRITKCAVMPMFLWAWVVKSFSPLAELFFSYRFYFYF
jgi:hypothetical protein